MNGLSRQEIIILTVIRVAEVTAQTRGIPNEPITDREMMELLQPEYGFSLRQVVTSRRNLIRSGRLRSTRTKAGFVHNVVRPTRTLDAIVPLVYGQPLKALAAGAK